MSAQQHRASRCVFVGNIPYDATEEQLVQICEEVGPVVSFRLVTDRDTGKPKGYGFCEFRDEETALSARRNLQGYDINGRQLRVDFAENEKGGGGVDRNRDQGRGGPGFQQSNSHLDSQKQANAQSGYGGGGATPLEQPMGRAAASAAAAMMSGTLGGPQQIPNMMLQPQAPMQAMNAPTAPLTGNGGIPVGADALTSALATMSKQQLYDVMSQMKTYIQQNQMQARQTLVQHPQLTKALFQAQIMLGMVRPPQMAASQPPQAQQLPPPQQGAMPPQQQLQPPPPRPLQPLALPNPAPMQPQSANKNSFPPMPQPKQQQLQAPPPQQQLQAPPPQQQQQQQQMPPHPPQGSFQGIGQTSLGMGFQQGPPPPPNQPPPSQLYQMGANLMGGNVPRMGANSGGSQAGQGGAGILPAAGAIGPAGSGQMPRLNNMDGRSVQLNHGHPPTSGSLGGLPGQNPMQMGGHGVGGSGAGGMGQPLPNNMAGSQHMGDPSGRGYTGLNSGMTSQMNNVNPGVNAGMNANMNNPMNGPINSGLNPEMNPGMPQGLSQAFNPAMNAGLNPAMNAGLHSNIPAGMNAMNAGLNMGLSAPQVGGFGGTTTGMAAATAGLQSQPYQQMQTASAAQQLQGQVPHHLEQQKALLQQVMNLTNDQIMSLPPDQRNQVLQLQQVLSRQQ